jgi:hypothetical protein
MRVFLLLLKSEPLLPFLEHLGEDEGLQGSQDGVGVLLLPVAVGEEDIEQHLELLVTHQIDLLLEREANAEDKTVIKGVFRE